MSRPASVEALPAFVALEVLPVLSGVKRGASIQLPTTYFDNRISVLSALGERTAEEQVDALRVSRQVVDEMDVEVDGLDERSLMVAAEDLRDQLRGLRTVQFLRERFPGECVVVLEFLRTERRVAFGSRLYFFRDDEAPPPSEIVRRNATAVVNETQRSFERYKGELHGYPDCCIDHFTEERSNPPSPEQRAVDALDVTVLDNLFGAGPNVSIERILPDLFETEFATAFCSRKFFPGPTCPDALSHGQTVYETLTDEFGLDETLVRDYYRLNVALCYVLAQNLLDAPARVPDVGAFGVEHVYAYLPLRGARTVSRYA